MKKLFILMLIIIKAYSSHAQSKYIDIASLHILVDNSKSEYTKQQNTRNEATIVTANETANKTILEKAKIKFVDLANRYSTIGTAIDAANIGLQATPMVNNIIQSQAQLIKLCQGVPAISIIALQSEIEFVERSKSLVNFLIGLSASAGVVNQMKMVDRRILFDFIINELSAIQQKSANLVSMVTFYNNRELLRSVNPFQSWIDNDKGMAKDVLQNFKDLKRP